MKAGPFHEHDWYFRRQLWQVGLSELLGTGLLSFTITSLLAVSPVDTLIPIAIGATLLALCNVFGSLSGAHFNPSITLAVFVLEKRFSLIRSCVYVCSEIAGALIGLHAAVWICRVLKNPFSVIAHQNDNFSMAQILCSEIVYTYMMTITCLNCAIVTHSPSPVTALWVAGAVVAASYAGGPISGACMNPALAVAFASKAGSWMDILVYTVGPVAGCFCAAGTCIIFDPEIWLRRIRPHDELQSDLETCVVPEMTTFPGENSRRKLQRHGRGGVY